MKVKTVLIGRICRAGKHMDRAGKHMDRAGKHMDRAGKHVYTLHKSYQIWPKTGSISDKKNLSDMLNYHKKYYEKLVTNSLQYLSQSVSLLLAAVPVD